MNATLHHHATHLRAPPPTSPQHPTTTTATATATQVLAEELEHTSATLAAMEASHAALGRTRDEYHGQHRKLRKSKGLLRTLNWQNKSVSWRGAGAVAAEALVPRWNVQRMRSACHMA